MNKPYIVSDDTATLDEMLQRLKPQQRGEMIHLQADLAKQFGNADDQRYTLAYLITDLLPKLEAARKEYVSSEEFTNPDYDGVIERYMERVGRQYRTDFPEKQDYWAAVSNLLRGDFADAYHRIASKKINQERNPWYQYLYGNKYALAVLTAIPGLFTLKVPVSTPIVMGAGAAAGYKLLYPFLQRRVNEDLHRLAEFTIHQQERIDDMVSKEKKEPTKFTLRSMVNDLMPMLETARLAGKGKNEFTQRVQIYMSQRQEDCSTAGHYDTRSWVEMDSIIKEEFLPRFINYAKGQNRIEEKGLWYRTLSNKWASAVTAAVVCAPLYFLTARMLPFGVLDDVLMAGLFATGGYHAPKIINPGYEDIQSLYTSICNRERRETT